MAQFAFEMHCQQTLLTCCYNSGMLYAGLLIVIAEFAAHFDV